MAYQVLARKWRPQRFADVVGQEHITRTLQNAILQHRVGHAYLFVGSRGIGKTTSARIFAKALNCESPIGAEPCCECTSCREIADGRCLDVIEIDAASNRKVENIRDLRETVHFTPARCRYKIYVIDEVHMLTNEAWNALLKTLEEPPPHVKFLFATTEPHKVLATIVSRCQRLDLKRLPVALIVQRLREIAAAEKILVDERALAAIGRAADGGMRDAQSIFDQMISFCGGRGAEAVIRESDVMDVFGLASGAELKHLSLALAANDVGAIVATVQDLADRGRDLEHTLGDLIYYFRNVMVCQLCSDAGRLVDASAAEQEDLQEVAGGAAPVVIQRLLEGLMGQEYAVRTALNKRVALEVALVRVMHEAHSVHIDELISRLNEWRQAGMPNLPAAPARPPPVMVPAVVRPPPPPAAEVKPLVVVPPAVVVAPAPAPVPAAVPVAPPAAIPARAEAIAAVPPPVPAPAPAPAPVMAPPPGVVPVVPVAVAPPPPAVAPVARATIAPTPAEQPVTVVPAPVVVAAAPPVPAAEEDPGDEDPAGDVPVPEYVEDAGDETLVVMDATAAAEPARSPASPAAAAAGPLTAVALAALAPPMDPGELWQKVQAEFATTLGRDTTKLFLKELKPISYVRGFLSVAYSDDMPPEQIRIVMQSDTQEVLQRCFSRVSPVPNGRLLIKRWIDDMSADQRKVRKQSSPEVLRRVEQNPLVQEAMKLFNGKVVDARG